MRIIVQNSLNDYGAGLAINAVSIEDAAPPREVADALKAQGRWQEGGKGGKGSVKTDPPKAAEAAPATLGPRSER